MNTISTISINKKANVLRSLLFRRRTKHFRLHFGLFSLRRMGRKNERRKKTGAERTLDFKLEIVIFRPSNGRQFSTPAADATEGEPTRRNDRNKRNCINKLYSVLRFVLLLVHLERLLFARFPSVSKFELIETPYICSADGQGRGRGRRRHCYFITIRWPPRAK